MNLYILRTQPLAIIILSVILTLVPLGDPTTGHHHPALDNELRNRVTVLEMQNWKCGIPKPRLVYVNEEHREFRNLHYVWFPPAAIVYRCEPSSGCCLRPTSSCQVEEGAIVQVPILFKKVDEILHSHTYTRLNFSNHTSCKCLPISS